MSDDVNTILRHQEQLATKRSNFDSWWQDIAYRVMPAQAQFTTESAPGEKRTERLFDSSAATANDRFAAVIEDLMTPRTQTWEELKPEDTEIEDDQEAKEYLERLRDALFAERYRHRANFASQKHQGYQGIGAFGNSCMFIDEVLGQGPRYINIHMREAYWAQDYQGTIDILYRRFKLQARQAVKKWGDKLPEKIRTDAEKNPWNDWEFIHCVRPNDDMIRGRQDYRGMKWASYYLAVDPKQMIDVGGFTSWPYAIGRYTVAPGEVYARSPAMTAWPAICTLNEEKKSVLRAGQNEVEPTLLLTEEGVLGAFSMRSRALNYGALSEDGKPLVQPLKTGANIPLGLELMQLERQAIEDSFLVSIFKVLAENPEMTATQVLEVVQQKATLLAPVRGRLESEDLGPMTEREIDIVSKMSKYAWIHEEMPESLRERGGNYKIEYTSPLARAARAQEGVAIMRTFEAVGTAITVDPQAAIVMDVKESLRTVAEINGVPARLIRSKDQIEQMLQKQAEDQQAAQAAAVAPEMSQAALNAAKAEQIRTGT